MDIFLWVFAIVGLVAGIVVSANTGNDWWSVIGILSFAVSGSFASIIGLLKKMSSKLLDVSAELALLRQNTADSQEECINSPDTEQDNAGKQKEIEEPHRNEEHKELENPRTKDEQRRLENLHRKKGEQKQIRKSCPSCGSANKQNKEYCDSCGEYLVYYT